MELNLKEKFLSYQVKKNSHQFINKGKFTGEITQVTHLYCQCLFFWFLMKTIESTKFN